jgi:hypothetical protein
LQGAGYSIGFAEELLSCSALLLESFVLNRLAISPGSDNWPESLLFRLFKMPKGNIIADILGKLDGNNPAKTG